MMPQQPWYWPCRRLIRIGTIGLTGVAFSLPGLAQAPRPPVAPDNPSLNRPATPSRAPRRPPASPPRRLTFTPPPPPKTGRARVTRGAATRSGSCPAVATPLTALVPTYTLAGGTVIGLQQTVDPHPTLWFYLPYDLTGDRPAELRLEQAAQGPRYVTQRTVLRLTGVKAGIIGVQVPETEPALEVGATANWTFVVLCDPEDASSNKFVNLSVQRVELRRSLQRQIKGSSGVDRVDLYSRAGLWENALTTLASLPREAASNHELATHWADLLTAIGVPTELSQQPVYWLSSRSKNNP